MAAADIDGGDLAVVADVDDLAIDLVDRARWSASRRRVEHIVASFSTTTTSTARSGGRGSSTARPAAGRVGQHRPRRRQLHRRDHLPRAPRRRRRAAEVAEHYRRINRKVTFEPGDVPPFRFARLAVRRAITNLVDNALRYAGDSLLIRTSLSGATAVLEVLDRGPGIPESESERVKRPFTRLDAARGARGGAGLGLAIVDRIAQAHRGRLELLPREGGGLVARLVLSTHA